MKRVFATTATATLAGWAAPASAGEILTHPGEVLSQSNPSFEVVVDLSDVFDAKLSFKTDGSIGIDACDGSHKQDCFSVFADNVLIEGRSPNRSA